jgi:protein ImuA
MPALGAATGATGSPHGAQAKCQKGIPVGTAGPDFIRATSALRREIAAIEGARATCEDARALPLDVAGIDAALGGGLALGAIHEIAPASPVHRGAAFGFALALACKARAQPHADAVVWIETPFAAAETGRPYGVGLEGFGLALARMLIVRVPRPIDVLWAMEEALGCRGIAAVIAEVTEEIALTATRRLSLAVRHGGGLGLFVRHRASPEPSAALTRWQVAAARSQPDAYGGLGASAAFDLTLTKNRHGPCGRWTILWDHHERVFVDPALSVGVAQPAVDRSDRALLRAG